MIRMGEFLQLFYDRMKMRDCISIGSFLSFVIN
jgi:hypothetical protein